MIQECGLAILAIDREESENLNYKRIKDGFAAKK